MRVLRRIPHFILDEPFEGFLAVLCVLSGLPLALGQAPPRSLYETMPLWLIQVWGAMLLIGSTCDVIGLVSSRDSIRLLGLRMLGNASFAYAFAISALAGPPALVATAITLAFSFACFAQAFKVNLARDLLSKINEP